MSVPDEQALQVWDHDMREDCGSTKPVEIFADLQLVLLENDRN
jgi:hypothetical protein